MSVLYPAEWKEYRVVLAHDWLTGMRGGERCLELVCRGMPGAPLLTLVHEPQQMSDHINRHPVTTSSLQRWVPVRRHFRLLLPWFPRFVEGLHPPPADLLLSMSHCVAKGVRPPEGARHLCYCFTPMRYGIFFDDYFGRNPLKRTLGRPMLRRLQEWDRRASEGVDRFVAISEHVRRRIRQYYDRESDVVYPPVDTERFTPGDDGGGAYDLLVSALVPYKRVDLAVGAYTRLGYPLKVVGIGSEYGDLRRRAGANVEFLGWQPDEALPSLYRGCRCLVFPGEEDFGIVPLEAQACGRPVVAYGRGGATETLRPGETGVLFPEQTEACLLEALEECAGGRWDGPEIRRNAERFGVQPFIDGLAAAMRTCLGGQTG